MEQLSVTAQTIYAELLQQIRDAEFDDQFPPNGSFVTKTQKDRKYWYYEGYETTSGGVTESRKYSKYVGKHGDPEIDKRVAEFKRRKSTYRERRALVTSLTSFGLPSPPTFVGDLVEALWQAGIFRLRGVLVGTTAYQAYAAALGVRLPSASMQTNDIDIAQDHGISMSIGDTLPPMLETLQSVDDTFRERPNLENTATAYANAKNFQVEFLTPNRGSDDHIGHPSPMPALGGAAAQNLRHLDFLIKEPIHAALLHKAGVGVNVPAPERYCVHKLIVSVLRHEDDVGIAKETKDLHQAGALAEALTLASRGEDLGFAWMEAWDRGPRWREHLRHGFARLKDEEKKLFNGAITKACEVDNKQPDTYCP
ncbi:MAG: GSU2403 family nucleotidyltransferase fold protein [Hyphomicrobiales bacterium]